MKTLYLRLSFLIVSLFIVTNSTEGQLFTDLNTSDLNVTSAASIDWGDYNNDTYPDMLINAGWESLIYTNNGDSTFTELAGYDPPQLPYEGANQWVDINNDGFLDIIYEGYIDGYNTIIIDKNQGNETFAEVFNIKYLSQYNTNLDFGDIDNDGDIDFIFTRSTELQIYENLGGFNFREVANTSFPNIIHSYCLLRDFDNDGRLDIMISGAIDDNIVLIYRNTDYFNFELHDSFNLSYATPYGIADAGDYNKDGFLDLFIKRWDGNFLYKNNGDATFTIVENHGVWEYGDRDMKWADLNNDGLLDLLLPGWNIAAAYLNNNGETFTKSTDPGFNITEGSIFGLGDVNQDGALDLAIGGHDPPNFVMDIYHNQSLIANTAPGIPTGLSHSASDDALILSWDRSNDDLTPDSSLSYNLKIGSLSGDIDIVSPIRSAARLGNAELDTFFLLKNLPAGTYFWSVQAIDNSYNYSDFSTESSFVFTIENQAFGLAASPQGSEAIVSWSRGNGEKSIVFIREGPGDDAQPLDLTSYTPSMTYGSGSQIDASGWYCIYSGTGNEIDIEGLNPDTIYQVQVFEFSGIGGSEAYNTDITPNNSITFKTGLFTRLTSVNFPTLNPTTTEHLPDHDLYWLDYDNDNDLDVLLRGEVHQYLYRNDGNEQFTQVSFEGLFNARSVAITDNNLDNYVDLVLTSNEKTIILINNKDGSFTSRTSDNIPAFTTVSIKVVDYDNDGDEDLLFMGQLVSTFETTSQLYRRNTDSTYSEVIGHQILSVFDGSADWGDFNRDGFQDLVISGKQADGSEKTQIFSNGKDGSFTMIQELSTTVSDVKWGDYNSDGFLDILYVSGSGSHIYENNGLDSFIIVTNTMLEDLRNGTGNWGDYDSDGDLDFVISGYLNANRVPYSKLLTNIGYDTFEVDSTAMLIPAGISTGVWGDYDNDGDLDLLMAGNSDDTSFTYIYRNEINKSNPVPPEVDGLSSSVNKSQALLSWQGIDSDNTPNLALSYNIRIGTSPGGSELSSALSSTSGYRRKTGQGNIGVDSIFTLYDLPLGTYYWSVQAVDNSFTGGPFSTEQNFSIVEVQASKLSANIISDNSMQLNWDRGNGNRCVVFAFEGNSGTALPTDDEIYLPDAEFGYGDELGNSGWYCVYNGRSDSIILSGLTYKTEYSFHIIEYIDSAGSKRYFSEIVDGNPGVFSTGQFSLQSNISFTSPSDKVEWGDYNNDGFSDVIVPGFPTKLYKNKHDNSFEEISIDGLEYLAKGMATWGDYDNDGDLDLFVCGDSSQIWEEIHPYSAIYRNDGSDVFTEQTQLSFVGVHEGYADWGDFDNDNDLDLIISGATKKWPLFEPTTRVYQNNGDGSFSEFPVELPDVALSTSRWVDYDGDGHLDIYIGGIMFDETGLSQLYLNSGENNFIHQDQFNFAIFDNSQVDWGDYDNDGDKDLILCNSRYSKLYVYRNMGNYFETIMDKTIASNNSLGDVSWADYDNDGFLDLVFGNFGSSAIIYRNIEGDHFEQLVDGSVNFAFVKNLEWCDFDNDGDIDFFVLSAATGATLYKNNLYMNSGKFEENRQADSPANLRSVSFPEGVRLAWDPILTDETEFPTLSYNLKIGTQADSFDIFTPSSDSSGFRRVSAPGNIELDTSLLLNNLDPGRYYWSIQAIDQAHQGGIWSQIDSFDVRNLQAFFENDTVCLGVATQFSDQSVSTEAIETWLWDFGDSNYSSEQNPLHTFQTSGFHQVKLIIESQGIIDSIQQDVFVEHKPIAAFDVDNVCQGTATIFVNTTQLNGSTVSQWTWDFGDGATSSVQNPPAYGYLNTGDYTITLTAEGSNGCTSQSQETMSVAEYPVATVSTGGNPEFCEGDSLKLSVPENANYTYQWNIGSIAISNADSSTFYASSSGNYTVSVINQVANCQSESPTPAAITVSPTPSSPLIQVQGETEFCSGDSVELSVSSIIDSQYNWKLNGGAIGSDSISHVARSSGTYSLEVVNSHLCVAQAINDITLTVYSNPTVPVISFSGEKEFCEGGSLELSTEENEELIFQWKESGDNISSANANVLDVLNSGDYKVLVTNVFGCSKESQPTSVTVNPIPTTPFIQRAGDDQFCEGSKAILSYSAQPDITYEWRKDAVPSGFSDRIYTVNEAGVYTLLARNNDNCEVLSSNSIEIIVYPNPDQPAISQEGSSIFCDGDSIVLTVPPSEGNDTYQWYKNNSPLAQDPGFKYTVYEPGDYRIQVQNVYGCLLASPTISVTVNEVPSQPIIASENYMDNECREIDPVILSVLNPEVNVSYQWIRNDSIIEGEVSDVYEDFLREANYKVRATSLGCVVESDLKIIQYAPMPDKPDIIADGPAVWYLACSNDSAFDYQWYFNNELIEGANDHIYVAGTNMGVYMVGVSEQSCYSYSDPIRIPLGTGMEENPWEGLIVYPNPSPGLFTLEMDNSIMGELIIDIIGERGSSILNIKFLKETQHFQTQIDLSGQPAAMYLISLMLDKHRTTRSLVVE